MEVRDETGFMERLGYIKKQTLQEALKERDELKIQVKELEAKLVDLEKTKDDLDKRVEELEKMLTVLQMERKERKKKKETT